MTPEQKAGLYEKLIPVVVGAFLGSIPAITISLLQSRAAIRQVVVERQFSAIKDFTFACTRRIKLAERLVYLYDIAQIDDIYKSEKLTGDLLRQFEQMQRDLEDSRVDLEAQIALANALFLTNINLPSAAEAEEAQTKEATKANVAKVKNSLPKMEKQCHDATAQLVSKLER